MATYLEIITDIQDELLDEGSLTVAEIKKAILRSIRQYERRPWWFNQKQGSFPTIALQEYYGAAEFAAIPAIVQIESANLISGTASMPIIEQQATDIDQSQSGFITGMPTQYTVYGGEVRFYPIPDAAYTISLAYIGRLTELAADADSNAWTTYGEELIREAAKKRLALDVLHAEDVAARCAALEKQALDDLLAENRRREPVKVLRTQMPVMRQTFNMQTGV